MSCCFSKKFFIRSRREDRYKVDDDELSPENTVKNSVAANQPQFSWDVRDNVDRNQYVIENVHGEVHKREGGKKDVMQIENCTEAFIFVLQPTSSLTIDDCRDTFLVLGPCSGSLFIRDCSNCTILASCQQLRFRDCHDIQIGLLCPTQPIIENSNDIHFHPLSLTYSNLKNHMRDAGLSLFTNRIKTVHDFTPEGGKKNYKTRDEIIELTPKQLESMESNEVSAEAAHSILPVFGASDNPYTYIYTEQESDESLEDLYERASVFTNILKSSTLKLIESHDIDTNEIDIKLLPISGKYEHLIVFKVVGEEEAMVRICKENYDLFKILDVSAVAPLENVLGSLVAKKLA